MLTWDFPFLPCFSVVLRCGSGIHRPGSTHAHRCRSCLQLVPAVVNSSCFHTEPSRNYVVESATFKYNKFFKGQREDPDKLPSVVVMRKNQLLILRTASQVSQNSHTFGISWCRYRKMLQGLVCERQGIGLKTLLAWEQRIICITFDRRSIQTVSMKSDMFHYICPHGLFHTAVSYSRDENPSLSSHKNIKSHEKMPKQKTSKTDNSSAVSVPSAVEINPLSPLPTSYCPFSVSEKSSEPFQEIPYTPITRCAKQTGRSNGETCN